MGGMPGSYSDIVGMTQPGAQPAPYVAPTPSPKAPYIPPPPPPQSPYQLGGPQAQGDPTQYNPMQFQLPPPPPSMQQSAGMDPEEWKAWVANYPQYPGETPVDYSNRLMLAIQNQEITRQGQNILVNGPGAGAAGAAGAGPAGMDPLEAARQQAFDLLNRQRLQYAPGNDMGIGGYLQAGMAGQDVPYTPSVIQSLLANSADSVAGQVAGQGDQVRGAMSRAGLTGSGLQASAMSDIYSQGGKETRSEARNITSNAELQNYMARERARQAGMQFLQQRAQNEWLANQAGTGLLSRYEITGESPFASEGRSDSYAQQTFGDGGRLGGSGAGYTTAGGVSYPGNTEPVWDENLKKYVYPQGTGGGTTGSWGTAGQSQNMGSGGLGGQGTLNQWSGFDGSGGTTIWDPATQQWVQSSPQQGIPSTGQSSGLQPWGGVWNGTHLNPDADPNQPSVPPQQVPGQPIQFPIQPGPQPVPNREGNGGQGGSGYSPYGTGSGATGGGGISSVAATNVSGAYNPAAYAGGGLNSMGQPIQYDQYGSYRDPYTGAQSWAPYTGK